WAASPEREGAGSAGSRASPPGRPAGRTLCRREACRPKPISPALRAPSCGHPAAERSALQLRWIRARWARSTWQGRYSDLPSPVSLLPSPVFAIFPPLLSLTFLGTGAACPTIERNVASIAVQREGETMLFDCGEGTQRQMMRYGVSFTFRDIFFTHWHSDHLLGVIGLLRTMGLLNIFGGQERRD